MLNKEIFNSKFIHLENTIDSFKKAVLLTKKEEQNDIFF